MEIAQPESMNFEESVLPPPSSSPPQFDSVAEDEDPIEEEDPDPDPETGGGSPVQEVDASALSFGGYSRYNESWNLDGDGDGNGGDDDGDKNRRWPQWNADDDDSLQLPLPLPDVVDTKSASAPPSPFDDEKPAPVGAGLLNLGNTCFLNSVLQCLTHTMGLVQRLSLCAHHMPCEYSDDRFCVFCAIREHVELSLSSTGRVVSPYKLVDNLSYISSSFQRYQQEDAHEFLQCFLDRLDSSCSNLMRKDTALASEDDNLVKQVFGGRVVSRLRCCNCNHSSDTYEPSVDFSLEIDDADTVSSALESFTKVERIEDADTKFTCENCKEEVLVEKQLMLEQAPAVSALHLKRFKNYGSYVEKIEKHVDFPLELDLEPYTMSSEYNVDLKYDLYAVVVHTAWTSTSGHYYCFVRAAPDTWYKFDDSKVVRVREAYVLSQEAYILFYAKQGTPWLSSFMETYKPLLDPNVSNASPKSVLDNVDSSMLCLNVPSDNCGNANKTSQVADEIPAESFRHDSTEFAEEDKADFYRMDTSLPSKTTKSEVEKVLLPSAPSALKEYNFNRDLGKAGNNIVTPKTPTRSPSPDIYNEEASPEVVFSSKRLEVKSEDRLSSKRQDLDDPKIREAFKMCRKMHGSRGTALFDAVTKGSQSEGSLTKKSKKRVATTTNRDYGQSSDRQKRNHNPFARSVAASSIR